MFIALMGLNCIFVTSINFSPLPSDCNTRHKNTNDNDKFCHALIFPGGTYPSCTVLRTIAYKNRILIYMFHLLYNIKTIF